MTDEEIEANTATPMATVSGAAMYRMLAIVGALAERPVVDSPKGRKMG